VVERAGLAGDELLVIAGDNLFEFSLADYVAWWRGHADGSAIAVRDCGDREQAKRYAVVSLGDDERIASFVEKPENPADTLVAIATYLYHRDHVPLLETYLAEGNSPDAPGNFIAWLHRRVPVYGYRLGGTWFDIGDREQLLVADNWVRGRTGMPRVGEYAG
jgi:glucose-1-phosphate thymidylyltransferase